ncbi:uncharacterized protein LOC127911297 [Oncorhynchus keta]|uniref:uncharacterized protein LOC127911297 n=1 Tax=Oncorhynchus keta TaxID=8018 RepID=UPI00227C7650|nr:uncharacterized protein LOC127911297 [Oncorhynchus keta]
MLYIDYSSAFNTIVPFKLIIKLGALGLNPTPCNWVLDFLMGCPQVVKVGNNISTSLILNTGAPQGCMLSPLQDSLFTHDCVDTHTSNSIIKCADDTTAVGLMTNNDETTYREEVRALGEWCKENNFSLNVNKAKGADRGLQETAEGARPYPHLRDRSGEGGKLKFLCVHITDDPKGSTHTDSEVKKVQQRLFNFRRLKKFVLAPKTLTNFYKCIIESILWGCITA